MSRHQSEFPYLIQWKSKSLDVRQRVARFADYYEASIYAQWQSQQWAGTVEIWNNKNKMTIAYQNGNALPLG